MSKTKKKKKHRLFWHFFRIQLVLLVLVLTAAAYYFYGGYGKQVEELKQEAVRLVRQSDVDTFKANQTSIVYASDGSVISTLKGEKDSYYVSIEEMPVDAVTAIVSIEDKKFFRHHGIDYRALLRAVKAMVQNGEVKYDHHAAGPEYFSVTGKDVAAKSGRDVYCNGTRKQIFQGSDFGVLFK